LGKLRRRERLPTALSFSLLLFSLEKCISSKIFLQRKRKKNEGGREGKVKT
jgi:hypothetical protein